MLTNLELVLEYARKQNCAVAGFNVFGYEDANAVIRAAEKLKVPVILMANKVAVNYMPIKVLGDILVDLAEAANVPVCVHLDHSPSVEAVMDGIEAGFTSVMLDVSTEPYEENARKTIEVVKAAHSMGVSVESEIGSVGYADQGEGAQNLYTDPEMASRFAMETKVDALAVSIGNVHRMTTQTVHLQFDRLARIKELVSIPLVLHGSSGVPDDELRMAVQGGIRKVNIGTALRMEFGNTLRKEMEANTQEFDRLKLFAGCMEKVQLKAEEKIKLLSGF